MNIHSAIEALRHHIGTDIDAVIYAELVTVQQMDDADAMAERIKGKIIAPFKHVSRRELHWTIHAKEIDWTLNGAIQIFWVFEDGSVADATDLGFLREG
jgi:hypothetical protein